MKIQITERECLTYSRKEKMNDNTPTIVTLCGSTRFPKLFQEYSAISSLRGCIVLSVGLYGHKEGIDMKGDVKRNLDRLHFQKISISDAIFVLNKDGYIGLSTWDEIFFAISKRVSIFFIEPLKGKCADEFKSVLSNNVTDPHVIAYIDDTETSVYFLERNHLGLDKFYR